MDPKVAAAFHKQWHESIDGTWHLMRWHGVKILKTPCDLFTYQEIIHATKPNIIIETGTCFGGSALFLAETSKAKVITIDIKPPASDIRHPRITCYTGSSIAPRTVADVRRMINGPHRVMVILDSNHHAPHVLKELKLYSPFVTQGCYLIVEDTDLNRTVRLDHGPGPADAIDTFLKTTKRFEVDRSCERYHLTFNPGGYLKCVS